MSTAAVKQTEVTSPGLAIAPEVADATLSFPNSFVLARRCHPLSRRHVITVVTAGLTSFAARNWIIKFSSEMRTRKREGPCCSATGAERETAASFNSINYLNRTACKYATDALTRGRVAAIPSRLFFVHVFLSPVIQNMLNKTIARSLSAVISYFGNTHAAKTCSL